MKVTIGIDIDHVYFVYDGDWSNRVKCHTHEEYKQQINWCIHQEYIIMLSSSVDSAYMETSVPWILGVCSLLSSETPLETL